MRPNPRNGANILSLLTFGYTLPFFKKGYRKGLSEDDLFGTVERCGSKICGDRTEEQWKRSESMSKILWRRFGFQYTMIFFAMLFFTEFYSILQPYGASKFISYFETNQTKISYGEAAANGALLLFLKFFTFFYWKNVHVWEIYLTIELCTSLKSLLYQKALRLRKNHFNTTGVGNIVTVITKDIYCIESNIWVFGDVIAFIIQILTSAYLLWAKLGHTAFIGIGLLLIVLPIQFFLSLVLTKLRLKVGKCSDKRLQTAQEALSAIKIIKMYNWEDFFIKRISAERKKEVKNFVYLVYLKFLIVTLGTLASRITFLVLLLFYLWMGYNMDTQTTFYVYGIFSQLSGSLSMKIPQNMASIAQIRAAASRINSIMDAEEITMVEEREAFQGDASIVLRNIFSSIGETEVIANIDLEINMPGLIVLTGPVGSGKSTFLKVLLREIPVTKGNIKIKGTISYASQESWLFPATIKQNILFGEKYEYLRYQKVIDICDLSYDLSLMEKGDETIISDRGQNLSKGQQARINLARAVYRKSDICLLDDCLAALDGPVQSYIFQECIMKYLKEKICILVSQNISHVQNADRVLVFEKGRIEQDSKPETFHHMEKIFSNTETTNGIVEDTTAKFQAYETSSLLPNEVKVYHEVQNTGKVSKTVYKKYFQFAGSVWFIVLVLILYIIPQIFENFADKLLATWIDENSKNETGESNVTLKLYTTCTVLQSVFNLIKYCAFLVFCKNISFNIHELMLERIVKAKMEFFDKNFIGNILNRLSFDLNIIDEDLPFTFPVIIGLIFASIGSTVLIATVNWHFFLPLTIMGVTFLLMETVYIPVGRNLKRLEAAIRSPMVGHINSTLEGLMTIRAFGATEMLKDQFHVHQDNYNSAVFTSSIVITCFQFYLETVNLIFASFIVVRFLFFEHDVSVGNVGLAIMQAFILGTLVQDIVDQWIHLETGMTSVERVLEYTDVDQERKDGSQPEKWPHNGEVEFENVSVKYGDNQEFVLKDVTFSVWPRQKIGIVGRTGAGKSSIISALFKLYEYEGTIRIDGTDIRDLSIKYLRAIMRGHVYPMEQFNIAELYQRYRFDGDTIRHILFPLVYEEDVMHHRGIPVPPIIKLNSIAIIPQDPILFSGTIRENIDSSKEHPDKAVWQTILRVGIKDIVPSLDKKIQENDNSYSVGQKQLICLARAAMRRCKVIVLDEATANMDPATERMLEGVIEEVFRDCTRIVVAHRLRSVLNCDMVLVMDRGKVVEFGEPKELMKDQKSLFFEMCQRN